MGKKRRGHPDVEEILGRAWCYYCERDFEDLKLLISHQKAKHFKCDRCGRRLNTAGGLSVHMNQVHKENLTQVENALPNRQGLEVEIFGMEGIPQEILDQHRNRIIQNFYQAQEDRRLATGNPLPGQASGDSRKKIKIEAAGDLKSRLEAFRAKKKAAAENGGVVEAAPASASPGQFNAPFQPPQQQQFDPQYSQPGYPAQPPPSAYPQQPYAYNPSNLPARPGANLPNAPGLPQRPGFYDASAAAPAAAAAGDDIDKLIRMAEAGIKPEEAGGEKKKKGKDKNTKMIYDDAEVSPEERMAALPRYAFAPEVAVA